MLAITVILTSGCFSSPKASTPPPPPRRVFESVEINEDQTEAFIVGDYLCDGLRYRREAILYSTALFLSDAGKLENTSKEQFEHYAKILFEDFPAEGETKQVVIPGFSGIDDPEEKKNAYIFISKVKNREGNDYYRMETNIPIASITDLMQKKYNGYVMSLERGLIRNKVPGSWVSVMGVAINDDSLIYQGVAYPAKAAPLIFTGRGIGPDTYMSEILKGKDAISNVKTKLEDSFDVMIKQTKPENNAQEVSMKFLEKYTYLSLAAYLFLEAQTEKAKIYYAMSQDIKIEIPDDRAGSSFLELDKIMNYLHREFISQPPEPL
jgi:hypothetical protein